MRHFDFNLPNGEVALVLETFEERGLIGYALRVAFEHTSNARIRAELREAYRVMKPSMLRDLGETA
jgi:hypothetical protein